VRYVVAAPVVMFLVLLVVGAVTGRVRVASCCSVPSAEQDRRLEPAVPETRITTRPGRVG
jgi:hypothetical protein